MLDACRPKSCCCDKVRYSPNVIPLSSMYAAASEAANSEHFKDNRIRSAFLASHGVFGQCCLRTSNDLVSVGSGTTTWAFLDFNAAVKSSSRVFSSLPNAQKRIVDDNNTSWLDIVLVGRKISPTSSRTRSQSSRECSRSQFTIFSEILVWSVIERCPVISLSRSSRYGCVSAPIQMTRAPG